MKLAEVEQKARKQWAADIESATQKKITEEMAAQAAREKFRQEIIAWMVQEGDLDARELGAMLSVPDVIGELRLTVPEHQPITFTVIQKGGTWHVRDGRFWVLTPGDPPWPVKCRSLGEALIEAGLLFQQTRQEKAEGAKEHKYDLSKNPRS